MKARSMAQCAQKFLLLYLLRFLLSLSISLKFLQLVECLRSKTQKKEGIFRIKMSRTKSIISVNQKGSKHFLSVIRLNIFHI